MLMGIPSYFSHITRRHAKVLNDLRSMIKKNKVDHLFLDANSIIYDASKMNHTNQTIYNRVAEIIKEYIKIINPSGTILVAFDGVAPMAKMVQQRTRRCKGTIEKKYAYEQMKWDTIAITPGTDFMNELPDQLRQRLPDNIHISGPDEPGEGEHKIFRYIRDHNMKNDLCVVYGLDADLIMLSMLNIPYCKQIYLARETQYFYNNDGNEKEGLCCMDISMLTQHLCDDIRNDTYDISNETYISDYIFICFLLGNDFLPHFPSINIRNNGIDLVINAYKKTISKHKCGITYDNCIRWKCVRTLIRELAHDEYGRLVEHYAGIDTIKRRMYKSNKMSDRLKNIPLTDRRDEEYIDPYTNGWEQRYYSTLFNVYPDKKRVSEITRNYIEGLEWTFQYYKVGCIHWTWCYHYNYPPLLNDLINEIPYFDVDVLKREDTLPVHPLTQLSYVIPYKAFHLLPSDVNELLHRKYDELCNDNYEIKWAFCRYFWESNITSPEININDLERDIIFLFK